MKLDDKIIKQIDLCYSKILTLNVELTNSISATKISKDLLTDVHEKCLELHKSYKAYEIDKEISDSELLELTNKATVIYDSLLKLEQAIRNELINNQDLSLAVKTNLTNSYLAYSSEVRDYLRLLVNTSRKIVDLDALIYYDTVLQKRWGHLENTLKSEVKKLTDKLNQEKLEREKADKETNTRITQLEEDLKITDLGEF
jgi:hypothetical protein